MWTFLLFIVRTRCYIWCLVFAILAAEALGTAERNQGEIVNQYISGLGEKCRSDGEIKFNHMWISQRLFFSSLSSMCGDDRHKWWEEFWLETYSSWRQFEFDKKDISIKKKSSRRVNKSEIFGGKIFQSKRARKRDGAKMIYQKPRKWKLFTERFSNTSEVEKRNWLKKLETLFRLINYL